jgi:hypothetical protein
MEAFFFVLFKLPFEQPCSFRLVPARSGSFRLVPENGVSGSGSSLNSLRA